MLAKGAPPPGASIIRRQPVNNGCTCKRVFMNLNFAGTIQVAAISATLQSCDAAGSHTHAHSSAYDASQGAETQMPGTREFARNFNKLNAQKLKTLASRNLLAKKSRINRPDQQIDVGNSVEQKNSVSTSQIDRKNVIRGDVLKSSKRKDSDSKNSNSEARGLKDRNSFGGFGSTQRSADYIDAKRKTPTNSDFFSRKSFADIGCAEFMIQSMKEQHFLRPSSIQALAFPHVIKGRSCMIADQSGSGKTLAYLIPVIQRLRLQELEGLSKSSENSPRILIVVPTSELASQVLNVCRSMSKCGIPFRSMVVTGGHRQKTQLDNLKQGVDVLIATPGRFLFLVKEGCLQLSNLECAVLDEVDVLFNDEDFEMALQNLISNSPVNMQYLFVTATLPVDIYYKLIEVFPDCKVVMGPSIHRTSARLEEVLIDCSGDENTEKTPETAFTNKKAALVQLIKQRPVSKTIIFCNKIETCRQVENVLKRSDRNENHVRVLPFHSALAPELRLASMKEFMSPPSNDGSLFLVSTDRASRGIDFTGVDHVVLFDFPRDPSEYVRRVGRTARGAGGKGKAFIFVVGKQVSLARRIIDRNQKGHPLHEVPCAYELTG